MLDSESLPASPVQLSASRPQVQEAHEEEAALHDGIRQLAVLNQADQILEALTRERRLRAQLNYLQEHPAMQHGWLRSGLEMALLQGLLRHPGTRASATWALYRVFGWSAPSEADSDDHATLLRTFFRSHPDSAWRQGLDSAAERSLEDVEAVRDSLDRRRLLCSDPRLEDRISHPLMERSLHDLRYRIASHTWSVLCIHFGWPISDANSVTPAHLPEQQESLGGLQVLKKLLTPFVAIAGFAALLQVLWWLAVLIN